MAVQWHCKRVVAKVGQTDFVFQSASIGVTTSSIKTLRDFWVFLPRRHSQFPAGCESWKSLSLKKRSLYGERFLFSFFFFFLESNVCVRHTTKDWCSWEGTRRKTWHNITAPFGLIISTDSTRLHQCGSLIRKWKRIHVVERFHRWFAIAGPPEAKLSE